MKSSLEISRRKFISNSALGSIGTLGVSVMIPSCMRSGPKANESGLDQGLKSGIVLRPYQLLCAICTIGEKKMYDDNFKINSIRKNPDIPVTLHCNAGDTFAYQDPGPADDTHGNAEFNRKRDLEILQRLDLPPGITLPARIILHRIWDRIESVSGICDGEVVTSNVNIGCPKANSGFYEKGREISLLYAVPDCGSQLIFSEADLPQARYALLVPRTKEERAEAKSRSLETMYRAEVISVRPHILMCAVCQYGGGIRPPLETDNLPEMLQLILKNRNSKILIAEAADWMMCAPCPSMNKFNACVNIKGHGGLSNQLRDVRVLQKLGLNYGDIINAQELYRIILKHIPSSSAICGSISKGVREPSVWDDGCGHLSEGSPDYVKGRELLIKEFGFNISVEPRQT
jgi:hypothetical protein